MNELKRIEKKMNKLDTGYRKIYDFTRDKIISTCGDHTKNGGITMDKANNEKIKLAQKLQNLKVMWNLGTIIS